MGGDTGRLREEIRQRLLGAGALAVGFAKAEPVTPEVMNTYERWLEQGRNAGMAYMNRYKEVRRNPRLLLEAGAESIISMAFSYSSTEQRNTNLPHIARYALLPDYHKWIRRLVAESGACPLLGSEHTDWRLCVDTAPIFERYWAFKAGIAVRGRNGAAIIPGVGAEILLAEIITTKKFEPDIPATESCLNCNACLRACPTGALQTDGTIDCDRCLSYLTIEHKGSWTDPRHLAAAKSLKDHPTLFGCDRCIEACPLNNEQTTSPVAPLTEMLTLNEPKAPAGSCLKRAGKEGLRRNLFLGIVSPGSVAVEL